MLSRLIPAAKQAVRAAPVRTSVRMMGGHHTGPEPYLAGTIEGDYIHRRYYNEIPPPPGTARKRSAMQVLTFVTAVSSLGLLYYMYGSRPATIVVERHEIDDPAAPGKTRLIYIPTKIHRFDRPMPGHEKVASPYPVVRFREALAARVMEEYLTEVKIFQNLPQQYETFIKENKNETDLPTLRQYVHTIARSFKHFKPYDKNLAIRVEDSVSLIDLPAHY
jgi:hypothetical protein